MPRFPHLVATLLIAVPFAPAEAQCTRGVCLGVHLGTIRMDDLGYGVVGVGGRIDLHVKPSVALELEANRYLNTPGGFGGDVFFLAGIQLKHLTGGKNALFMMAKPGIAWFRSPFTTGGNPSLKTKPAFDLGMGFERAVRDQMSFRIDVSDTVIFFGDDLLYRGTLERHRAGVSHNPSLTVGIVIHLTPQPTR